MVTRSRKSVFSNDLGRIDFEVRENKKREQAYKAIILDVCGAHNPTSKFSEETFTEGLWLLVAIFDLEEIHAVSWDCSIEEFKGFGDEGNIKGRKVVLICDSVDDHLIRYARIQFQGGRTNSHQDESTRNFVNLGSMYNLNFDRESELSAYKTNVNAGRGEIWSPIK